ncbi:hypothetical protein ALC62_15650 [Cyphomyrmex costatus]|uniref:Tyr recombinase domain-containing protein n=1 Tax=Cyphomyrmex costatus TaxID=456900 RepID=A0A151I6K2_9HYME|nr:hypothetical protein ALC62_15650 [Cyphomyrmex costatus]
MKIPSFLSSDFDWWISIFADPNQSNKIRLSGFVREIFLDASLNGWGAAWGMKRTHGWWSESERSLHINALELKAAFNGLRIRLSQILLDTKLIIRCPERTKTSAPGRPQPFFCFSRFSDHDNLCIVLLTEHYIKRTKNLRPSSCDYLFISLSKSHRAISAQTFSRWLKGINTEIFSAHSTRHASTSRAAQKGVTLDLIKKAAGWTGESRIFAKFYNRPIINPENFAEAVLLP